MSRILGAVQYAVLYIEQDKPLLHLVYFFISLKIRVQSNNERRS
jgi:hypothetical protein